MDAADRIWIKELGFPMIDISWGDFQSANADESDEWIRDIASTLDSGQVYTEGGAISHVSIRRLPGH